MTVFWDVAPCNLVDVCRRIRGGKVLPDYMAKHPRRQSSLSQSLFRMHHSHSDIQVQRPGPPLWSDTDAVRQKHRITARYYASTQIIPTHNTKLAEALGKDNFMSKQTGHT
jgi:hypothetical protein